MLSACSSCNRRLRLKSVCVETGKKICKKCCEMHTEGCDYHPFCWSRTI